MAMHERDDRKTEPLRRDEPGRVVILAEVDVQIAELLGETVVLVPPVGGNIFSGPGVQGLDAEVRQFRKGRLQQPGAHAGTAIIRTSGDGVDRRGPAFDLDVQDAYNGLGALTRIGGDECDRRIVERGARCARV